MPIHQTFVTQLLRIYHGSETNTAEKFDPPDLRQARYLCDVGLGPIAFRTYGEVLRESSPEIYSILLSADLTTRVIYKQMENSTVELLTSLQNVGVTPVLVKGISTAYEFYSPSHLRLMGDVDILVQQSDVETTMRTLDDLGYKIADQDWQRYRQQGHHHLPGARNPGTGVTVEVHTSLISPEEPLAKDPIFQPNSIETQILEFEYSGVPAARFTPELQLVYTVAHWGLDGNWAVNVTSINDVIHILRGHQTELKWSTIGQWISRNPWLYPNIAALMTYLDRVDIVAMTLRMREALANTEIEMQRQTMRTLLWMLHNYPFNARDKFRDGYAIWRAGAMWQELTQPNSRDIRIPYYLLRTALRSIHHGKYNPLGWLLSFFRYFASRLRAD
jgi:hypothetical protein